MVFLLYMVLATALFDIIGRFVPSMGHSFLYALAVTTPLLIYGYINYRMPRAEHITIDVEKPIEGGTYRIVAISDVHLGHGTSRKDLARYVDMVNSHNPDVVLIVGDLIDNSITPVRQQRMEEELRELKAPMGIYMAAGNHEYISKIGEVEKFLNETPITLLRDSVVTLPCGIQIVGRDDRHNHRRKSLGELLERVDSNKPIVVLDHQPYNLAEVDAAEVDIQLSGHTHRGQVWPLSLLTDYIYEQSHGYRKWQNTHIYVSSGLSLWGPPFRIGTNSELAIITVKSVAKP
jgi:predicted MPP superfamily phosphohydrolase